MSFTPSFYALLLTAVLIPATASAEDATRTPNLTTPPSTTGSATVDQPPQAPVGHRQPRAADIPADRKSADDDEWLNRVNRDIDSKLRICRDC